MLGWKLRNQNRPSAADLFTLLNSVLGFYAVVLVARGDVDGAVRMVLVAGVADGMDGLLARRGRSSSFGENLDSLADVVSFCVAPALLLSGSTAGFAAGAVFLLAGLFRLARFNVTGLRDGFFDGLPSTGAGLTVATSLLAGVPSGVAVLLALSLSPLMASRLPYWKPRGPRSVPLGATLLAAAALPLSLGGIFPKLLLTLLLGYAASGFLHAGLDRLL